jgi:hypothetical protein
LTSSRQTWENNGKNNGQVFKFLAFYFWDKFGPLFCYIFAFPSHCLLKILLSVFEFCVNHSAAGGGVLVRVNTYFWSMLVVGFWLRWTLTSGLCFTSCPFPDAESEWLWNGASRVIKCMHTKFTSWQILFCSHVHNICNVYGDFGFYMKTSKQQSNFWYKLQDSFNAYKFPTLYWPNYISNLFLLYRCMNAYMLGVYNFLHML